MTGVSQEILHLTVPPGFLPFAFLMAVCPQRLLALGDHC